MITFPTLILSRLAIELLPIPMRTSMPPAVRVLRDTVCRDAISIALVFVSIAIVGDCGGCGRAVDRTGHAKSA